MGRYRPFQAKWAGLGPPIGLTLLKLLHSYLKASILKKFELLDKFRVTKLEEDNLKYKKHLNLLTHMIKKAEFLYYRDLSIIYGNDKSKTWKLVNEISHRKRKKRL